MSDNQLHQSSLTQPRQVVSSLDYRGKPRFKDLFAFTVWKHSAPLAVGILASLLAGALKTSLAIILGEIFGAISSYGGGTLPKSDTIAQVSTWCGILAILGVAGLLISFALMFSWTLFSELQVRQARRRVFHALLEKEMHWYDCQSNGVPSLLVRTQTQIQELQSAICIGLGNAFTDIAAITTNLFLAFYLSWKLTLVILATVPPSIVTIHMISRSLKSAIEVQKGEQAVAIKYAIAAITGIDLVRAFNGADQETWRYADAIKRSMAACLVQSRVSGYQMSYVKFWLEAMFVIGFFYGVVLVSQGMNAGNVITTFYAALAALQALESLISIYPTLLRGVSAGRHLQNICKDLGKRSKIKETSTEKLIPAGLNGEIKFHDVTFAFPSDPSSHALKNISITFTPRQLTFIVGPTGAGKSTIGDLLVKLYEPKDGHISIDGVPLPTLDTHWVRRNITLVQQHGTLFDDFLSNNITLGLFSPQMVSEADIDNVCDAALLQHTVASLPDGLRTRIGRHGHKLSTGEVQRVAIARALLRDPEVLILDEVTTGLDPQSRILIMDMIRKWRRNKSTIIITHDMALIKDDDHVCVMENGLFVQQGLRNNIKLNSGLDLSMSPPGEKSQSQRDSASCSRIPETDNTLAEPYPGASLRLVPPTSTMFWPIPTPTTPRYMGGSMTITMKSPIVSCRQEGVQHFGNPYIQKSTPDLEKIGILWSNLLTGMWSKRKDKDSSAVEYTGDPTFPAPKFQTARPGTQPKSSRATQHDTSSQKVPMLLSDTGRASLHALAEQYAPVPQFFIGEEPNFRRHGANVLPEPSVDDSHLLSCTCIFCYSKANNWVNKFTARSEVAISLLAIYRTVWPHINKKARCFLISGIFSCLVVAASVPVFSIIFANLLSALYAKDNPIVAGQRWALYLLLVAVTGASAAFLAHYHLEYTGQSWVNALRAEALSRILRQPRPFFDKPKHAPVKIMECMDHHAEEMRSLVGRFGPGLFMIMIMVSVTVVWAMIINWRLTLVALSGGPIIVAASMGYSHVTSKWEGRYNRAATFVSTIITETFTNIRIVKALTLEQYFSEKHEKAVSLVYWVGLKRAAWTSAFFACCQSMLWFVMALIFYYSTTLFAAPKSIEVQDALNVVNLLVLGLSAASQLLESIPSISAAQATAGRLLYYANLPVPAEDFQDQPPMFGKNADMKNTASATPKKKLISPFPVRMDGLCFSYQPNDNKSVSQILRNITLEIQSGTAIAIAGPSGCGKSTLASLLLTIRNPAHIPQVRNIRPSIYRHPLSFAGLPPNLLDLSALRSQIAYMPQDSFLFPMTISQNIIYGLRDSAPFAKEQNIQRAAQQAGILDFINSLPNGFNTVVGEGGQALSGGQAQRICLARAIVRQPKLLILDEPTSSLDWEAAEGIRRTISRLIERAKDSSGLSPNPVNGRYGQWNPIDDYDKHDRIDSEISVVVITHSVEMMKICDKILVLDTGRIVEQGNFRELINKKGRFVDLIGEDRSPANSLRRRSNAQVN